MKIICAGCQKTGTKSLARALTMLGYKVYDYDDQFFLLNDLWTKIMDGTATDDDIRNKLENIDVLIDGPVIAFWEEIYRVFPEAKVILTIRDEESWWKSFKGMIATPTAKLYKFFFVFLLLTPTGRKPLWTGMRIVNFSQGIEGPFSIPIVSFTDNPRLYKFTFRQHNSHVLQTVEKGRLLVYSSGDGWGPLCTFLGKDLQEEPYPHLNKKGGHFTTDGGPKNPAMDQMKKEVIVIFAVFCLLLSIIAYYLLSLIW